VIAKAHFEAAHANDDLALGRTRLGVAGAQ
jgi:hypothetical protein